MVLQLTTVAHGKPSAGTVCVVMIAIIALTGCRSPSGKAVAAPPPAPVRAEPAPEPELAIVQISATESSGGGNPLVAGAGAAVSDPVQTFSIDDAVRYGLENNPRLREAAARVEAAQAGEDIAFAPFLPEVGTSLRYSTFSTQVLPGGSFVPASLNAGVSNFTIAEAGIQWTIYDFGRTSGRYGQAVNRAQIEKLASIRACQTVAFDIVHDYCRLLTSLALVRVRNEALRQAQAILNDTKVMHEAGTADRDAVLRAEVGVTSAEQDLLTARQAVLDDESTLNVAMGRFPTLPLSVIDVTARPEFEASLEESIQQAYATRPEVRMAQEMIGEAAHGEQAARGDRLPKIYTRGTVLRADSNGPLQGWVEGVGLHLEQPLYAGGKLRAEVRRSSAQVSMASAAQQSILQNIALQTSVAYHAIETNRQRIRLGELAVGQAKENIREMLVKYQNGNATPTDVVDAQTALTGAETRYYTAVNEYLDGLSRLEYAQGGDQFRLLASFRSAPSLETLSSRID